MIKGSDMKKLLMSSITFCLMFFAASAWAGSSRVIVADTSSYPDVRITIYAEGDSIATLTLDKNDYKINGTLLYGLKTNPATPDAVYDVAVSDSDGVLCDAEARSTTATEGFSCDSETGKFEKVLTDLTVAVDNLGAGSTTIHLDFIMPR